MKKLTFLLALFLGAYTSFVSFVMAETTESGCEHPFIDVIDHWAEESICFLYSEGTVEGHSDRNFKPNDDITRAEFLKICLLNLGYTVYSVQTEAFTDTSPGDWYYQYVTFARSKGFVTGYMDGSFHPNDPIDRAEAVVMIMNIAGIIEYDVSSTVTSFYDVNTEDWFAYAVAVATEYEIIEGYGDGSFRPYSNLTRAEASEVTVRTWEALHE